MAKPRRSRRNGKQISRRVTSLTHALNGVRLKVRPDPPQVVQVPWNNAVVTGVISTDGIYRSNHLYKDYLAQLGGKNKDDLVFRIQEVKAWEIGGHSLELSIFDLIDNDGDYLMQIEDVPGENHWACAGYVWPKTHQQRVVRVNDTATEGIGLIHVSTASGQSTNVKCHFKILWKRKITSLPGSQFYAANLALDLHRSSRACSSLAAPGPSNVENIPDVERAIFRLSLQERLENNQRFDCDQQSTQDLSSLEDCEVLGLGQPHEKHNAYVKSRHNDNDDNK